MKNTLFISLNFIFHIGFSQFLFQVDKDTCIKWNYFDGDEFNSKTLDETKWKTSFPWSKFLPSENIIYTPKNIILDSGLVKFRVNKEKTITRVSQWDTADFRKNGKIPDKDGNYELEYTGGLIWSQKKYKYGYFEVRFKNPSNLGLWPAFWLYGEKTNEIDFMELKGEKNNHIHVDVHCPNGCRNYITGLLGYRKGFGHWIKTDGYFSEQFNVVSGEWEPGYIKYFLNGNLIAYFKGNIDVELDITAGNGKAHDGGPFDPGVGQKTTFPSDFVVDYIRVWNKDKTNQKKSINSTNFDIQEETQKKALQPKKEKIKFNKKIEKIPSEQITISFLPLQEGKYSFSLLGYNSTTQNFKFELVNEKGENIFSPEKYYNGQYIISLKNQNFNDLYLNMEIDGKKYQQKIN